MDLGTHLFKKNSQCLKTMMINYELCSYASIDDNYFEKFNITDPILKFAIKLKT